MKISALQMYESTNWQGLTTSNHLGSLFNIEPQKASQLLTRIYNVNFGMDLDSYLNQFKPLYLESDDDFEWQLQGSGRKNVPLVSASLTSGGAAVSATDKAGINTNHFFLVFPEQYFTDVNLIVGEKNEAYPMRIVKEPVAIGSNWEYEVELLTGDMTLFVPSEELAAGKRFSKEWSPVSHTLSKKGGGVHYTSPFKMRNAFSMIRMQDTRPGNMINRPVQFSFQDENGKLHTTWMQYADYEFEAQFREEKNKLLYFATPNKTDQQTYLNKDKSGYEIRQGAGIRAQMAPSNIAYYNTFNIKWLTEQLLGLSVGKISQDKRKFVIRTGEWGMYQFSAALENFASLYTPLFDTNRVYLGKNNTMGFRGQFLEYMGPNGIEVTLSHEPMYDDPERNKIYHPNGGLAESYRYDILDVGTADGEPNIRKVYVKGQEDIIGYVPGLRNPFSLDGKNNIMANSTDGYTIHRAGICSTMIKNPMRCIQIIPNILA
jgi:hypothetical protein